MNTFQVFPNHVGPLINLNLPIITSIPWSKILSFLTYNLKIKGNSMKNHLGMFYTKFWGSFWWFDTIKFLWMHQLNHGYVACGIIIEKILRGWQSGQLRRSTRVQFKRFLVVLNPSSWISGQSRTTSRTNRPISDRIQLILFLQHLRFDLGDGEHPFGDIVVGDGCWRQNVLVTSLRCWWPI